MRRPAAVLSAATLSVALIAGSVVGPVRPAAAAEDPVGQITCGTVGPPVCDLVQPLTGLLAPLGPVLDLAGPALGDLGRAADTLTTVLEAGPDLPAQALADAAGALLDELGEVSGPVLSLLKGAGVDLGLLESTLEKVRAAALEALTPAAPAPDPAPAPAPAPAPSGGSTSATSSGGAATFDSGSADPLPAAPPASTASRAAPDVPQGSSLNLAPLGLPDFRLAEPTAAATLETATEPPFGGALERAAEPVSQVLADAGAGDSKATAVVIAISTLMLAAGLLIDQQRRARIPLRIEA